MPVPNLPFWLSQANTEFRGNGWATDILAKAGIPAPRNLSVLAGKSSGWRGTITIGLLTSTLEDNVGYNPLTGTGSVSGGGTVNNVDVTPNSVRMQWTKSRNSYMFITRFGLGTSLPIPVKLTFGGERVYKLGANKVSIVSTADDYNWFRNRVGQTISMTIEEDK